VEDAIDVLSGAPVLLQGNQDHREITPPAVMACSVFLVLIGHDLIVTRGTSQS
jgi:hypothetical protein